MSLERAQGGASTPSWWVYILRCGDGSLYTGISRDPGRRLRQHRGELAGGAKSLRGRSPLELVYREAMASRSEASRREYAIKHLPRGAKELLLLRGEDSGGGEGGHGAPDPVGPQPCGGSSSPLS